MQNWKKSNIFSTFIIKCEISCYNQHEMPRGVGGVSIQLPTHKFGFYYFYMADQWKRFIELISNWNQGQPWYIVGTATFQMWLVTLMLAVWNLQLQTWMGTKAMVLTNHQSSLFYLNRSTIALFSTWKKLHCCST